MRGCETPPKPQRGHRTIVISLPERRGLLTFFSDGGDSLGKRHVGPISIGMGDTGTLS